MPVVGRPAPSRRNNFTADSAAIVLTYFATAGAGMAFWIAAARLIPAHELGVQTALLSLITTIGTVTAYGVGSAYKAMLSVPGCPRSKRMLDGLVITIGCSCAAGLIGGIIAGDFVGGGIVGAVVVSTGSVLMSLFVLKDAALIGLHAAHWLPIVNLLAVVLKIALVCVLATMVGFSAVWATLVPTAIGALFVFLILTPRLLRRDRIGTEPIHDARLSRKNMGAFAFRDGIASTTSFGLILVLPFMTTWIAGPVPGATLALAFVVAQALDFVPDGIGAALTAHMARDPGSSSGRFGESG